MVISFANQKGGAQKSTLCRLMATSLHFGVSQMRVAMIDCDSQATNYQIRERELSLLEKNPEDKERFEKLVSVSKKPLYPIIPAQLGAPGEVKTTLERLQREGYNFILVDLPGNTEIPGLADVLLLLDYIFVPVFCDSGSIKSSVSYINSVRALMFRYRKQAPPLEEIYVFFTLFNPDTASKTYQVFRQLEREFKENGVKVLEHSFPYSPVFQFELASTLFPFPTHKDYQSISPYPLFTEMVDILYAQKTEKKETATDETPEEGDQKAPSAHKKAANE